MHIYIYIHILAGRSMVFPVRLSTFQVPTWPSVPTTTTAPGTCSATARRLRLFRSPRRIPVQSMGKSMGNSMGKP